MQGVPVFGAREKDGQDVRYPLSLLLPGMCGALGGREGAAMETQDRKAKTG